MSAMASNIARRLFQTSKIKSDLNLSALNARSNRDEIRIVIIGAGLAGLSAASHLIKQGFRNTIILEATDRYGGRVNSKNFGDVYCELGPQRIKIDTSKYSAYELVRTAPGLEKQLHRYKEKLYVSTKGEKLNPSFPQLVDTLFDKLCSGIELEKKYRSGELHELNNVYSYLRAESDKITKSMFSEKEQLLVDDLFTAFMKEFSSLVGCCLQYLNIEHITKVPRQHKGSYVYIPKGMDNMLSQIMSTLDAHHVKKGVPVALVKWAGDANINDRFVGCVDGSAFIADHVICTLPLGVLKTFSDYIFTPKLPKEKLKSIKNLGFGSPLKIYLEYEKSVRSWFPITIRPIWNYSEPGSDLKWTTQIIEISKMPKSGHVLELHVGGAWYEEIEKLPEKEIFKEVTAVLRKCLKNKTIPYPSAVLRSNWSSNACFLGGRPYFSTQSSVKDVLTLAQPLGEKPVLLFAGDATILNGFGSIDGARKSGIREAQRIIDFYSKNV